VADAYVLMQGLNLAKYIYASNLTVVGDSKLIVRYLIFDLFPQDFWLASILERIK
jgi:hypothetical protein